MAVSIPLKDIVFGSVLLGSIPVTILTSLWGGLPFRMSWWLLLFMVSLLVLMDFLRLYPINPYARWLLVIPFSSLAMTAFLQFALHRPGLI
jgi:hypothetical protein